MFTLVELHACPGTQSFPPDVWEASAEALLQGAVIVRPDAAFTSQLVAAASVAPATAFARFIAAVQARAFTPRTPLPASTCGCRTELGVLLDHASEAPCTACGRERVCLSHLITNHLIAGSRRTQAAGLTKGDNTLASIQQTIGTLLVAASSLTIVDPYAIADALRQEAHAQRTSGLFKLVDAANSAAVDAIHLYVMKGVKLNGQVLSDADQATRARALLRHVPKGCTVTLHVVGQAKFKAEAHDRWLGASWTGGQVTISLGPGLRSFDGALVKQNYALARQGDALATAVAVALDPYVSLSAPIHS